MTYWILGCEGRIDRLPPGDRERRIVDIVEQRSDFRIPRSRVHLTHRALRQEILQALGPLLFDSFSDRERVQDILESRFSVAMNQAFACGVHSGTVGLFMALRACGVGPGDEVITVGNSDVSTTAAISHCGATPVLCDILESDYTINPDLVEPLIRDRTAAILPVDLYGHPANVKSLREIADAHDLVIVEDAALAAGAWDYGMPVGAFADAAIFSFSPFKPLGCAGSGGMITTNDEDIARQLRLLCGYGHIPEVRSEIPGHQMHLAEGYNVTLDPLEAALVLAKLPELPDWTEKRRAIACTYADGLQGLDVVLPAFRPESEPTFRSYTVRVRDQQGVYQGMRRAGIEVALHYVPPVYRQPVYEQGLPGSDALPETDNVTEDLVCLPVTVELSEEEIRSVVQTLSDLL